MRRRDFIKGLINYTLSTDVWAKRQGNIVFIDIYADEADNFLHLDAYVDDRCYRQDATHLQPAEDGYAVDVVDINWSAYNDKTFHLTKKEKVGLEEWLTDWLQEDWNDCGDIATQAHEVSMHTFSSCEKSKTHSNN